MIEEIRISSLGVIERSTLKLGPGLTVITGETGAGKTMVVTALGVLLGGRVEAGVVRNGASAARVEGVVDATGMADFQAAVIDAGGVVEDEQVLLARNVSGTGRSRAYVGGASVPVSVLAATSKPLVAVHGQSDQHRLLQPQAQRDALDRFAGDEVAGLRVKWQELHLELQRCEEQLRELEESVRERAREADLLRFGLQEIDAVSPRPGEDDDLATEESRLGHSDTLRTAGESAREALSGETDAVDALTLLAAARSSLDAVREHDTNAAELADRVAEVVYLVADLSADLSSYTSAIETDPSRLAEVSQRRASLSSLTRKYGATIDEVLAWAASSSERLADLDGGDERILELHERSQTLRADLGRIGTKLTNERTAAAEKLASLVSAELSALAMSGAGVRIEVTQREVGAEDPNALRVGERTLRMGSVGVDVVEIQLRANQGGKSLPLAKGASGGELSRVMLALEVTLAGTGSAPTLVFDEVDAGVGGKAAVEVGARLARLAQSAQVLVVTHLPQVAAYADQHVLVEKASDGSVTTSGLRFLDDEGRRRELSRMLAGMEESDSALAHADELIVAARKSLKSRRTRTPKRTAPSGSGRLEAREG